MEDYYLDWCPRPINAMGDRVGAGGLSSEQLSELTISDSVESVDYRFRNDGFILFCIVWKDERPDADDERIGCAQLVTHQIKQDMGHTHLYNRKIHDYPAKHHFPTLAVAPVELCETNNLHEQELAEMELADSWICKLQAKSFNDSEETIPAILLLRTQYVKIFERARKVKRLISQSELKIPMIDFKNRGLSWIPVRIFGWTLRSYDHRWLLLLMLLFCIVASFISFDEPTSIEEGVSVKLSLKWGQAVLAGFWDNVLWGLTVLAGFFLVQQIAMKRRKILKALRRARGYMLFGDIYNSVLASITTAKSAGKFRDAGSFSTSIAILDDQIELEEKKRVQTYYWLLAMFFMSFESFYKTVKEVFPKIDDYIPILEIIIGVMQMHR